MSEDEIITDRPVPPPPSPPFFDVDVSTNPNSKLILNTNPIPSDESLVGAELTNQLVKLFTGYDVSSEENIRINTPFKFYSTKFAMYDFDRSHLISFYTENIASGNNRSITWRAMDYDNDFPVLEYQQQTLHNKVLGDNISISDAIDFNGFGIDNVGYISLNDLLDNTVSLFDINGVPPNTIFDLITGYNALSYPNIVPATSISFRLGFNSEIDSYLFYSKAEGPNTLLFSITPYEIDLLAPTVDFNSKNVTNLLLNTASLKNQSGVEPVATTTEAAIYRRDIDPNNQAIYITKIEDGVPIKVRVA